MTLLYLVRTSSQLGLQDIGITMMLYGESGSEMLVSCRKHLADLKGFGLSKRSHFRFCAQLPPCF